MFKANHFQTSMFPSSTCIFNQKESIIEDPLPNVEFSRPIKLDNLGKKHFSANLEATEEECAQLAKRLKLQSIRSLTAEVDVHRMRYVPHLVQIDGSLSADITQICKTTDLPFPSLVEDEFQTVVMEKKTGKQYEDPLSEEVMEMIDEELEEGGELDLGEIISQYFGLAVDLNKIHPEFYVPTGNDNIVWESSTGAFSGEDSQELIIELPWNVENDDNDDQKKGDNNL
eukprot:CAMPEP_0117760400 /NCGR_PEP_ID=MMETSP0947-20121206/16605_1 /TAXON_ID=44440 /ORGANISM="Chattonella subsalsa, Strain CCMP2191" /LENGTH=227 /DNA_ID=CAMNT_0005581079 /DNA_START=229 /DNA_END=912 /DNA_ORIENTATION=+